ncbi:ribosomal protein L7/L12 [Microbacterium sp. 22242]|uniref:ribosomal protein L7/L12 n=1 Tax=Microbacterium sp. 22242 TaxID=3453896 RepID=UPI003F85FCC5
MDFWIWILLAVAVVALVLTVIGVSRTIRPKPPEPLGAIGDPAMLADPATLVDPATLTPSAVGTADPLPAAVIAQIDALVAKQQPITAIKVLREHSGLSLREAKDQIDAWVPSAPGTVDAVPVSLVRSDTRPAGAPWYAGGLPVADAMARLAPDVRAEIGGLIAADQKIAAIKLLREATGLGLEDSKDAVESWR